jgi:DNA-binding CsgD family transcriptional regulator
LPNAQRNGEVEKNKVDTLTDRQIACLRMVADHMTSKEIARVLSISPYTVDQRLDAARRKLNVASRKQAALLFVQSEAATAISEALVYEPQPLARDPKTDAVVEASATKGVADTSDTHALPRNGQIGETSLLARLSVRIVRLSLPPLGGERHDLSRPQIALMSMRIAFYSTVLLAATIAIVIGTMRLF